MGISHIKQPDGNWTVFDSVTDTLIGFDMTTEEAKEAFIERAKRRAEFEWSMMMDKDLPHLRSRMTLKEACEDHLRHEVNCDDEEFRAAARKFCEQHTKKKKK